MEMLDVATFNEKYRTWWTPDYWTAVIESRKVAVPGETVEVYGTTGWKYGTRWSLCLRPRKATR